MGYFIFVVSVTGVFSYPVSCINSLGQTIELTPEKINDNYCDCDIDGVDEDLTSACSYLENSKFICINKEDVSQEIYASRVNDGVYCFYVFVM